MERYFDLFKSWDDVSAEFSGEWERPAEPTIKKPSEVIFAAYSYEDYSGDAFVIFRRGDRYFLNEGSHCSCYGLEGQWSPEEYSLPLLYAALEKRSSDYSVFSADHKARVLAFLARRLAKS